MTHSKPHFRYRQLADEMEAAIRKGTYAPGEKLPSIREFHRRLNVSINTAHQAYMELEKTGLIEVRPKSGFFVSPVSLHDLKPPVFPPPPRAARKVEITGMVNSVLLAISAPGMLSLAAAATGVSLLPHRQLSRIMKSLSAREVQRTLAYGLTEGHPELRRQLALRMVGELPDISPEDIIITTGCMEAVTLSLQALLRPGDTLAIETPTHFGFLQLFKEMGIMVMEIPVRPGIGIDIDALEKEMDRTRIRACLLMPNFHNPLGTLMPDEEKKRLVELCNRREVPIIEDDICAELYFDGHRRPSFLKAYDREDQVLTCSSFSKTLAPGFRIGWAIPGRRYRDRVLRLKAAATVCSATLDQEIMARYLAGGACERHLRTLRREIKNQVYSTALAIQKYFPPGTRLSLPDGGSLLWVQLPGKADGMTLYRKALEEKISILPGAVCSVSGTFENYIRIGCGNPFTEEVERGIEVLGRLIEEEQGGVP